MVALFCSKYFLIKHIITKELVQILYVDTDDCDKFYQMQMYQWETGSAQSATLSDVEMPGHSKTPAMIN